MTKLAGKKVLYVHLHNITQVGIGIKIKIQSQVNSFSRICKVCDFLTIEGTKVKLNSTYKKRPTNSIISRIKSPGLAIELLKENNQNYDILYMRGFGADPWVIKFLKRARPYASKVIYEFPTFPYSKELLRGGIVKKGYYLIDRLYRGQFKQHIDISTNYNNLTNILEINSMPITNCVEVTSIKFTGSNTTENNVRLLCVASFRTGQAYERVLMGLGKYYEKYNFDPKTKVTFDIVGDGEPIRSKLEQLTTKLKLDDYVIFHGTLAGEQLDPLYSKASIGIAPLGMHRSNNFTGSPLKVREYYARGLPLVKSYYDEAIKEDEGINFLQVEANETPLDISKVLEWYKKKTYDSKKMRMKALDLFSWDSVLSKVLMEA